MLYEINNNSFDCNDSDEAGSKITEFGKIYAKDGTIFLENFKVRVDKYDGYPDVGTALASLLIKNLEDLIEKIKESPLKTGVI